MGGPPVADDIVVTVVPHNYAHVPRQILNEAEDRQSDLGRRGGQ
jgi:hypothetical protein